MELNCSRSLGVHKHLLRIGLLELDYITLVS